MSLTITELEQLTGEQIDARVQAWLLEKYDLSTPEGAAQGQRRSELVTAMRQQHLWPSSERARGR